VKIAEKITNLNQTLQDRKEALLTIHDATLSEVRKAFEDEEVTVKKDRFSPRHVRSDVGIFRLNLHLGEIQGVPQHFEVPFLVHFDGDVTRVILPAEKSFRLDHDISFMNTASPEEHVGYFGPVVLKTLHKCLDEEFFLERNGFPHKLWRVYGKVSENLLSFFDQ